jgi:UPF0716 protein FxsA
MFLLLPLVLLALEVFVFIEVGEAIGWLLAVILLVGTSVIGLQLLRIQGRAAIERVSLAVSERRAPARAAVEGALGFLGAVLLVVPGFVTDAVGVLLLFPLTRQLAHGWLSHRFAQHVVRFASTTGRFARGGRRAAPADVDSTAVDEDLGELPR